MSTYKCVVVDDEELARELIEAHLNQLDDFELIASCASAIEASKVLKEQAVDLLFLDIEMPVLKGTDFYNNLVDKPRVIFTTAYRDYALDGFELDAVDYLLKPIVFARFFKAIERFLATRQNFLPASFNSSENEPHIFVKKDRKRVKVILNEVLYVQGLKDYVKIYLINDVHIIKQGMSAFEKLLGDKFVRVHRSYIVNWDSITAFTKNDVEIGDIEIPIGENYRAYVAKMLAVS